MDPSTGDRHGRAPWKTPAIIISAVVALLAVLYFSALWITSQAVDAAYDRLAATGRPMDPKEIIPPEVADEDNAAVLLWPAFRGLQAARASWVSAQAGDSAESEGPVAGWGLIPDENASPEETAAYRESMARLDGSADPEAVATEVFVGEASPEEMTALREFLDRPAVRDALRLVDEAVRRPACRFDLDCDAGIYMDLHHLRGLRSALRVVIGRAVAMAAAEDTAAAWRDIETGLLLAGCLEDEPMINSQLARRDMLDMTITALRQVTRMSPADPSVRSRMDELLAGFDDPESLVRALDGDRILLGDHTFRAIRDGTMTVSDVMLRGSAPRFPAILRNLDQVAYLDTAGALAEAAATPWFEVTDVTDRALAGVPQFYLLTRILKPSADLARRRFARASALSRIVRLGMAVRAVYEETGAFPDDFDGIANEHGIDLTDPFTGDPLIYRVDHAGAVVYSVGENAIDDGGKARPSDPSSAERNTRAWDLPWRVER